MTSITTEATATPDATTGPDTRRPMAEDDITRFVWIADPQMAPDASYVAFTRVHVDREADEYRTAIWLADVAGGARALTFGGRDRQPRWSPDGRSLAFVRVPEGKKEGELWVLPMAGGEARRLAALEGGISSPDWSPDGKRLVFTSGYNPALDDPKREKPKHEPGRIVTRPVFRENDSGFIDFDHRDHVWIVEVGETGEPKPRALTTGRFAESAPRWSADGRRVFFLSDRRDEPWFGSEENILYAVDPERTEPAAGDGMEVVVNPSGGIGAWAEGPAGRVALIATVTPPAPRSYDQATLLLAEAPDARCAILGAASTWPSARPWAPTSIRRAGAAAFHSRSPKPAVR